MENRIKKLYSKKDEMHDYRHILRLKRIVRILRKPYKNLDHKLLGFLLDYHGLKKYVRENREDFPREYVKSLMRHSRRPESTEEKLVFDANMLDNVGKHGIKKAFFVGKWRGRSSARTIAFLRMRMGRVKFYTLLGKKLGAKQLRIMKTALDYGVKKSNH